MAWENAYDVATIVSGDADYVGAVTKVMNKGKNVEVASFRKCLSKELRRSLNKNNTRRLRSSNKSLKVLKTGTP